MPEAGHLHVVVLDKDAGSWFIVDSSVVGYDGVQNVRDEEHSLEENDAHNGERKPWTLREFGGKTIWDWKGLLIVPVVLSLITVVFAWRQDIRQDQIENKRAQEAQKIEGQRAEAERELAEQRAQDEALQAYLDQMSQLMLERKLLEAEQGDPVHTLAQARTSTVILRLDAEHNESVTRFLSNSGLALSSEASARLLSEMALSHAKLSGAHLPNADLGDADLKDANLKDANLNDANLSKADLQYADLSSANLSNADLINADLEGAELLNNANLSGANLQGADLLNADLSHADLSDADLSRAFLFQADLNLAKLNYADLHNADVQYADLSFAYLSDAKLSDARLSDAKLNYADLSGADLSGADLSGAGGWTEDQLSEALTLEGATMPNGQKYEDWLKSKGKREK